MDSSGPVKRVDAGRAAIHRANRPQPISTVRKTEGNICGFPTKAMLTCVVSCGFTSACEPKEFSTWKDVAQNCEDRVKWGWAKEGWDGAGWDEMGGTTQVTSA